MRFNITQKISLLSVFLITLTATGVAFVFYYSSSKILISHTLKDLSHHVENQGDHLFQKMEAIIEDVQFLSNMPPVQGIVRASQSGGFDKKGNSSRTLWQKRLSSIFATLMHSHQEYAQIRYIDAKGYELLRVERDKHGRVARIPNKDLQFKGDRPYFTETIQLPEGGIYLSEIDLNREHGKIVVPHTPMLRAATPIYTKTGDVFGLVIINMDLTNEFANLQHQHHKLGHTLYVTNDRGDFLIHPVKDRSFGFDLGRNYKLQKEFPHLTQIFSPGEKSKSIIKNIQTGGETIASVFVKFDLPLANQQRFITMGMTLPYSDILSAQTQPLTDSIWLSVILIFAGITLSYIFSERVVIPIKQIARSVNDYASGKTDWKMPATHNDEIGMLARTFESMTKQITNNQNSLLHLNQSLEKKVALRTRDLSRFKTTLDMIHDSVFIFDPITLKFIYVNQGAINLTGYSRNEFMSMTPVDLQNTFSEIDFREELNILIEEENPHLTYQAINITKDKREIPVEIFLQYVNPPGEKPRFVIISHDIVLRKKIEEDIINAKNEAEKANKIKSEFLARVSHELRTPMNAILGFGQLLNENEDSGLDETHKMYVEEMMKAGYHLLGLINEVLDLSQIESGKIEINKEFFDCHQAIRECLSIMKPIADKRGITLEYCADDNILAKINNDKKRFMEIMLNFVSNAIKYNRPEGRVTITLDDLSNQRIRINITDTGMGLDDEQQQHLFNPFYRAGAEYSQIEGTGIGLVIVKQLVESMGGNLGFSSIVNKGSTFWVEFDIESDNEEKKTQEADLDLIQQASGTYQPKFKILYIEDNIANIQLVEHALGKYDNIDLVTTTTPNNGLLKAISDKPDLILLDINLPEMDGYEVLKRLRSNNETGHIPVVAITAYSSGVEIHKGRKAGFNKYMTKPIQIQDLYYTINQLVENKLKKNQVN
ncbi:MAG: ATP-binding protein [Gammaproteobacteria bacterium]|nr:ATP-binding protein [Gammaproteobacteria bacterium]